MSEPLPTKETLHWFERNIKTPYNTYAKVSLSKQSEDFIHGFFAKIPRGFPESSLIGYSFISTMSKNVKNKEKLFLGMSISELEAETWKLLPPQPNLILQGSKVLENQLKIHICIGNQEKIYYFDSFLLPYEEVPIEVGKPTKFYKTHPWFMSLYNLSKELGIKFKPKIRKHLNLIS